jgi:hypothetical protein
MNDVRQSSRWMLLAGLVACADPAEIDDRQGELRGGWD